MRVVKLFPLPAGVVLGVAPGVALWDSFARTAASASRVWLSCLVVVVLLAWLGVGVLISATREYQRSAAIGVLWILVTVGAGLALLGSNGTVSELVAAVPRAWPIEFQAVRLVGAVFLAAWLSGEVTRPWFCLWAGSLDVVVGFTAVPVAWWVATSAPAAATVGVVWNVLGLVDFVVAIVVVCTDRSVLRDFFSSPGPVVVLLQPIFRTIFAFAVPLLSIVHVFSLRQFV